MGATHYVKRLTVRFQVHTDFTHESKGLRIRVRRLTDFDNRRRVSIIDLCLVREEGEVDDPSLLAPVFPGGFSREERGGEPEVEVEVVGVVLDGDGVLGAAAAVARCGCDVDE